MTTEQAGVPDRQLATPAADPCRWCGGRRWVVLGDEPQPCWCVTDAARDDAVDVKVKEELRP
jgi:hypothetical protein